MLKNIKWNSQSLDSWSEKYARGKFIDLSGRRTHYIEKGKGDPVILLHGFFYDSYLWAENIDALAKNHKVYALDLWGFGYSTREPLDYGYQLYADQVLQFMDHLSIPTASLAGQSMGGGTAILFCLLHRERVNKLILVNSAGLPNKPPLDSKIACIRGVGEFIFGLKTEAIRKNSLKEAFVHKTELVTQHYFEHVTCFHKIRHTTEVLLTVLRKNFFDKLSDEIHRLATVDVPILIVWGKYDKAISLRHGEEMNRILKNSRLEILDNAGHVSNFDCAEQFNKLAVEFLTEIYDKERESIASQSEATAVSS
ncbi:dihydrolipoamide acetyltransferase [Fulvivirga imtechensis AK7]|uniref:Dihydrolipoamide acetyltransferase n=1 Tax=Fulvivirga imtechensis AK7 TaxID=1237149 RepID=L8JHG1_9BACT|nr:alpha/beta fold hydrolase [Fulvivirga imtechensis]ELR68271.1 dihydrolipoamide acetyltransferase [Fulvivirga imtechensis AK7]